MVTCYHRLDNLEDLRQYVYSTLCKHSQLELGAYQMTEMTLLRGQRPCGVYFCVYGPRKMRLSAIWDSDRNLVLFYDSAGERFQKTQLASGPRLRSIAA